MNPAPVDFPAHLFSSQRQAPACVAPGAAAGPVQRSGPAAAQALGPHSPLHIVYAHRKSAPAGDIRQRVLAHPLLQHHRVHWHACERARDLPAHAQHAAQMARSTGGVPVAMGGDGTTNTVAQAARAHGLPMALLPMGTFNFFARQHALADSLEQAMTDTLHAVDHRLLRPVNVGDINGQVFLVNASMGLYPRLLAERERASHRWGRNQAVAMAAGVATLLRPLPQRRLALTMQPTDGDVQRDVLDVSTLFVGNNALQLAQVGLPESDAVAQGALGALMLPPASRWDMARLMWRAARGTLAEEPLVRRRACRWLEVRSTRGGASQVRVAFDGERASMRLPIRFSAAEQPLWLLVPPPAQGHAVAASGTALPGDAPGLAQRPGNGLFYGVG